MSGAKPETATGSWSEDQEPFSLSINKDYQTEGCFKGVVRIGPLAFRKIVELGTASKSSFTLPGSPR